MGHVPEDSAICSQLPRIRRNCVPNGAEFWCTVSRRSSTTTTVMADKLADELLKMILVPSLTISYTQFTSSSPVAFGKNATISSASVLLVCKRWLRVATPLLYESVVIRSVGQSHALCDAFCANPAFAAHVKKVRLEGAYDSIDKVLGPCKNLVTLVILLRIFSDARVVSLCRALPMINPKVVILRDDWRFDNAKLRTVFSSLCEAIPTWSNMVCCKRRLPLSSDDGSRLCSISRTTITRTEPQGGCDWSRR